MKSLFEAFLFFLPAGLANMAPVFANKIPILNRWKTPLDFSKKFHGKRILGNNKTWRGLVCGTLIGSLAGVIINLAYPDLITRVATVSFTPGLAMLIGGAAMGAGALLGDAIESFFKRRTGVGPGDTWFPFDQIDYIAGGLLFSYPIFHPTQVVILNTFMLYFGLHIVFSYVGYLIGLKNKPI